MTYNGKSKNWYLLLSHCRYFDKSFAEMVVECFSTRLAILVQTTQFDWLPRQPKGYIYEKILKNQFFRSCKGDKDETLQNCL